MLFTCPPGLRVDSTKTSSSSSSAFSSSSSSVLSTHLSFFSSRKFFYAFIAQRVKMAIWSSSSLASGLSVRLILSSLALALLLTTSTAASASSLPSQPAEHLVPPPLPTAQRLRHSGYTTNAESGGGGGGAAVAVLPPETGFMTRVARWFGLAGGGGQSSAQAQSPSLRDQQLSPSSTSYAYPKPVTNFNAGGKPCGLCNKYPWVPMVGQQQQLHSTNDLANWKGPLAQASSQHRQRAVQFRPPPSQSVFLPMAGPNPALSHVAIPPLYSAQPFRPIFQPNVNSQQQPLENLAAQSELRPVPAVSTTLPGSTHRPYANPTQVDNGFEIIKSHQLTDFVTSVEYPATFVQSHAIDLGASSVPSNHRPQETNEDDGGAGGEKDETISTVRYQLEDLASGSVHQHLPASRLLTELGHFADSQTTTVMPPADNYPAASSQQQLQQEQEQQLYYAEQYIEQEQQEQEQESETSLPYTTTTEPSPAPFISLHHHHHHRDRETPKRLLDSPIKHARLAGEARPFTRDPAELNFRLSQVAPTVASEVATEVPTPTSTYGAIDASGQFAGMSRTNAYSNPQQVIIPYTTKQKPRPFEPWTKVNDVDPQEQQESKLTAASVTPPTLPTRRTTKYLTKILATNLRELLKRERDGTKRRPNGLNIGVDISRLQHNIDGWTEQEYNSLSHRPSTPTIRGRSKHIPSEYLTTTTTTPAPPVTSQLIRQSKTTRGGGFELASSLPATSPIAGDLSTSINNLEHLHILGEKLPKRFHPVDDNHLQFDYYAAAHHQDRSKSTTTSAPSTSAPTTSSQDGVTPLYDRTTPAPMELWKQAKVAILPQTNEKVYVVTPQPPARHQARYHHVSEAEDHHEASASASAPRPVYQTPAPRFSRMRPTPGAAAMPTTSSQLHNYTPDIFGLMGLSSYVPAEPVEIIDGNSKVINIVTPAPLVSALKQPTAKPSISPSPR